MNTVLFIDGTPIRYGKAATRYLVRYLDRDVYISRKSFVFLVKLAYARLTGNGWIAKERLEPGDYQARYILNLRRQLGCYTFPCIYKRYPNHAGLIVNDRKGRYALNMDARSLKVSCRYLIGFPDIEITRIGYELENEGKKNIKTTGSECAWCPEG